MLIDPSVCNQLRLASRMWIRGTKRIMSIALTFVAAVAITACGGGAVPPGTDASSVGRLEGAQATRSMTEATSAATSLTEALGQETVKVAAAATHGSANLPSPVAAASVAVTPAENGDTSASYVTVRDGHLYRNNKRLRQWGVNLQSGVFPTYAEIDLLVERMVNLGFNAVRLWPTGGTFYTPTTAGPVPVVATRGDGTARDRYDYLVHKLSAAGMTIQMTALHYWDLPSLRSVTQPEVKQWVSSARNDSELRMLAGIAPYVSNTYRQFLKSHMQRQLSHVNPYTERPFFDEPSVSGWELANESRFVECSLTPECIQALPPVAFAALSARWQESSRNRLGQPLPTEMSAFIESATYPDYARFVYDTFIAASEDMRANARGLASSGKGVAVQPFVFNTGPVTPNAVAHLAYGRGDIFSVGSYRSPLQQTGGLDGSAWLPTVVGGKVPAYLNHVKIEGKPMVIYETSFLRPYSYRAEWGPLMAAIALQQDWDGVFLYQYGQPYAIYSNGGSSEGYGTKPLPEPGANSPNAWKRDYTYGFHHGGDPVAMASWSIAARIFTSTKESAPLQRSWRLSLSTIFARKAGYPGGYIHAAHNAATAGSVAIDFVENEDDSCTPCVLSLEIPKTYFVRWPTPEHRNLDVKSPGGRTIAGMLPDSISMIIDDISANLQEGTFGVVAALRDFDRIDRQIGNTLHVIGDVKNTGMTFDRNLVRYDLPYGAIYGLTEQGTSPLIQIGPKVEFRVTSQMNFTAEDFKLSQMSSVSSRLFKIDPQTTTFRVRITP